MKSYFIIHFLEFPPISESVKNHEPYYWNGLELKHAYKVISDYEKIKGDGTSEHFLLLVNNEGGLQEVPLRNNIKVNFVN